MTLSEFIVSEFWLILLIVSMLLYKPYRIPALFILTIKITNDTVIPPFLITMVMIGVLLEMQTTEAFIHKQKLGRKSKI